MKRGSLCRYIFYWLRVSLPEWYVRRGNPALLSLPDLPTSTCNLALKMDDSFTTKVRFIPVELAFRSPAEKSTASIHATTIAAGG